MDEMQFEYLDLSFKPKDIVTINFKNCGGYVNSLQMGNKFANFKMFDKTTNNIFIVLTNMSLSCYCLTQYGIYVFLNSHLKLL